MSKDYKVKNIRFDAQDVKIVDKLTDNFTDYTNKAVKAKIKQDLKHEPRIALYNTLSAFVKEHGAVMANEVFADVLEGSEYITSLGGLE